MNVSTFRGAVTFGGAVAPAASNLGVERVEPVRETGGHGRRRGTVPAGERPEPFEPGVELRQRCAFQPVDPPLRTDLARDEAGLAQHAQVPADGRTGDGEARGDLPRPRLTGREHLDDLPAHRVGEGGKDEHSSI